MRTADTYISIIHIYIHVSPHRVKGCTAGMLHAMLQSGQWIWSLCQSVPSLRVVVHAFISVALNGLCLIAMRLIVEAIKLCPFVNMCVCVLRIVGDS